MSLGRPIRSTSHSAISGAMYAGVPASPESTVTRSARSLPTLAASPQSITNTSP